MSDVITAEEAAAVDLRKVKPEDKACPKCGKMVSGRPGPYAAHVSKCKPAGESETPTPKRAASIGEIKDSDIRKLMETAQAIQEAMRESPNAFVGDITSDENMILRRTYAPETLERFDKLGRPLHTHTAYIEDARRIQQAVARGYFPVISEQGKYVTNSGGDILCTLERKMRDARIHKTEQESRARIGRVTADTKSRNPNLRDGDLNEESLGVVGEVTLTSDDRSVNKET